MARLIDADLLMEKLNVFNDREHGNEHFINGIETAKELLEDMPTTTEAEIRAKAIDEFAEKLKREYVYIDVTSDDMVYGKYRKYIDEIAEKLKGNIPTEKALEKPAKGRSSSGCIYNNSERDWDFMK